MNNEILLTPEELYFLGTRLQAKYIDYAYVAAMDDIGQNFSLFEKETGAALVNKGVLQEDFSGNIQINPNVSELLNPIFFGEIETSIDVCEFAEKNTVTVRKFHFYDGIITMVTGKDGMLQIKAVDQTDIKEIIKGLLPLNYNARSETITETIEKTITRFVAVKSICIGKSSVVKTYFEADEVFYCENDQSTESVSKDAFISEVYRIVKGDQ